MMDKQNNIASKSMRLIVNLLFADKIDVILQKPSKLLSLCYLKIISESINQNDF